MWGTGFHLHCDCSQCSIRRARRVVGYSGYIRRVVVANRVHVPYPLMLTSPLFARLNEVSNVMGALRGCPAAKFVSCNSLRSSVHTVLVNILRSVSL